MGAFIATTILNTAALSPRAAKLLAFYQEHADNYTGISFWSKAKVCAALQISESTYARALRELRTGGFISVNAQYRENGSQTSNLVQVKRTGHHYICEADALDKLSYGAAKVYLQIARRCGKGSYAISRRSLSEDCNLSMSSITRIVRDLQTMGLIEVTPETRRDIFGNNGQTYNRFRVPTFEKIKKWILCVMCLILQATHKFAPSESSPLIKRDTPITYLPVLTVRKKKTKSSILAKLKEIVSHILSKFRRCIFHK